MNTKGMKFLAVLAVLAMAFAVFAVALPANDADEVEVEIYVDAVDGSDKNKGTQESPVKTVEKALELIGEDAGKIILLSDYTAEGDAIEFSQLTIDLNGKTLTVDREVSIAKDKIVTIKDSVLDAQGYPAGAMFIGKNGFGDVALFNSGKIIVDGAIVYVDILHVAYASYLVGGDLGEIVATSSAFIYGDKDWDAEKPVWDLWVGDGEESYFALGADVIATVMQTGPTSALVIIEGVDELANEGAAVEVRGHFDTRGVDILFAKNLNVTVTGAIELSNWKTESVTEISELFMGEGSTLTTAVPNDDEKVPAILMEEGTKIVMANGATFDGVIKTADGSKVNATFTAGEKGIKIIAGSITITGVMDATVANAILDEAEGTVILDELTVVGDGNNLEVNSGNVIIEGLALDDCNLVVADGAKIVVDGTVASVGETESVIEVAADGITTTGRADIEVEVDTGGTPENPNYPEYTDGDRVMKDGTMFTIGHAKASSGRMVQFGVALSVLVFNGEDQQGEIKNATVTSFDNFYPWTSAGMPKAWIWPDDPDGECLHAGYYNLEVYFGVTNGVTTTTINALIHDGALIDQAPSDVTLVEYEASKIYDASVSDLGIFDLESRANYEYYMSGYVMFYDGTWAPGTWPEDMAKGYYVLFQVEDMEEYIEEFPDSTFAVFDGEFKAFDGYLIKFIGTTMTDVEEFCETPFEFYLDNDGTDGEYDDYKPTLYTIYMDLQPFGYDVTIAEIDDDFKGVPIEELVEDDFELTVVPANSDNDENLYDVHVSGTLLWYDELPIETEVTTYKHGYFVPFQIVLPESKTFDDVDYIIIDIPGAQQIVLQKEAKHILVLEASRDLTLTIGMEGEEYVFNFDLEDADCEVAYKPTGEYIADVSGYDGVLHGFEGDYVDDMFDMVFADTINANLSEVYYYGMDRSADPALVYSNENYAGTGFESIFWVAYADLDDTVVELGDGFYDLVVKNTDTGEIIKITVMRGMGIEFVYCHISDYVMDCGVDGELFSAVVGAPNEDGVYPVDFTANKLYYIPQWIVDILAQYGVECKAGYYLAFEIDYGGKIITEDATVDFADENIAFEYSTGKYFVYLGANKAFLENRLVTIDVDGEEGEIEAVDFLLIVAPVDEGEFPDDYNDNIGYSAIGIILKDTYVDDRGNVRYYDDIYLNCENGQYVKLPDGKDSTRNFVRWALEIDDERAFNWDSIYIVSWYDDINPKDGQIVFTAVYDDTPGPQPVVTEYTITVDYVCDGVTVYSETETVIEGQYYFFDCDVPELEDYLVSKDYVVGKAFADETITVECIEKPVADEYRLLIAVAEDVDSTYIDFVCVADGFMEAGTYEFTIAGKYIEYDEELELYTSETEYDTFIIEVAMDGMFFIGSHDFSDMEHFEDLYSIVLECSTLGVKSVVASLV